MALPSAVPARLIPEPRGALFDALSQGSSQGLDQAVAELAARSDLAMFPKDHLIIGRDRPAEGLYVVSRGLVQQRRAQQLVAVYGPNDHFDLCALFGGAEGDRFIAVEDTICHIIPEAALSDLARENADFAAEMERDVTLRLRALAGDRSVREMTALTMARIRNAYTHAPLFIDHAASLRDAAAAMRREQASCVLVRGDNGSVGILTGTDLRNLVILDGHSIDEAVGPLARYDLLTLERDDPLLRALVLMTKHSVRRVVVTEGGAICGILEQTDLLGALSNHSQVISLQIERASSPEELGEASHSVTELIRTLHATGVKTGFIADLITELNRKILRRLYELLAPADLQANSCLIVMGSEGRGEQLLKTDQDNGLILRDGYSCPDLPAITTAFTEHLVAFGYPLCPGRIMVSNPEWTRSLDEYKGLLHTWIHRPDEGALMNLAIFYDAAAVAGDSRLLDEAKRYCLGRLQDNQMFFTIFARPTIGFDSPSGLFGGLFERRRGQEAVDIKKSAIFPIVHGVRALALEKHLTDNSTCERINGLMDRGVMDRRFGEELIEAFQFLSTLRLNARVDDAAGTSQTDNLVTPARMSKLERDQFNDCVALVKRFKDFITYHFHLNI